MLRTNQVVRFDTHTQAKEEARFAENNKKGTIAVWIMNAIHSLPTSEDLRKTYFWESRRLGAQESEKYASEKRLSRLRGLWKAQWYSPIKLRLPDVYGSPTNDEHTSTWQPSFAVIQGHRFLWWRSVQDFDNGKLPAGRIVLSGHSGLTGPSPIESRELSREERFLVVGIFGRGLNDQERVIMLMPDSATKERLESTILVVAFKDD
jgi:hypothetical protein